MGRVWVGYRYGKLTMRGAWLRRLTAELEAARAALAAEQRRGERMAAQLRVRCPHMFLRAGTVGRAGHGTGLQQGMLSLASAACRRTAVSPQQSTRPHKQVCVDILIQYICGYGST